MAKKKSSSGGGGGVPWWVHTLWMVGTSVAPIRKCRRCGKRTQLWRRNCPSCGEKFW